MGTAHKWAGQTDAEVSEAYGEASDRSMTGASHNADVEMPRNLHC